MQITQNNKVKAQHVNDLFLNELEEETVHDFRCPRSMLLPINMYMILLTYKIAVVSLESRGRLCQIQDLAMYLCM